MVTLKNEKKGIILHLSNQGVQDVLDSMLHEIERYNEIMNMCTDKGVHEASESAKLRIYKTYTMFCQMLQDDED